MVDTRIRIPASQGGLTRYFDEYRSKISFAPGHIIILCLVVMVIVIILHYFASGWLGLSLP